LDYKGSAGECNWKSQKEENTNCMLWRTIRKRDDFPMRKAAWKLRCQRNSSPDKITDSQKSGLELQVRRRIHKQALSVPRLPQEAPISKPSHMT